MSADDTKQRDILESIKDISVSWWIPSCLVGVGGLGNREKRLLVNSGVSRLVESQNVDVVVLVFLDDSSSVIIGVERVHKDEWDIDTVSRVEVLLVSPGFDLVAKSSVLTSICLTDKSRKVIPSRTSMMDLGPTHPIVVPRPPFNFKTASLSRIAGSTLGRTS